MAFDEGRTHMAYFSGLLSLVAKANTNGVIRFLVPTIHRLSPYLRNPSQNVLRGDLGRSKKNRKEKKQ